MKKCPRTCPLAPRRSDDRSFKTPGKIVHVDMDEFIKAGPGELLQTGGVSTCTAFIATYPGKFGYLAHISPYDKIYGGRVTNLLGHILKKVKLYDIYKYERPQVRFIIVANHVLSLSNIVDKLVDEGFMLNQIHVFHNAAAGSTNVTHDYTRDKIRVEWLLKEPSNQKTFQGMNESNNLGSILKQYLDDEAI